MLSKVQLVFFRTFKLGGGDLLTQSRSGDLKLGKGNILPSLCLSPRTFACTSGIFNNTLINIRKRDYLYHYYIPGWLDVMQTWCTRLIMKWRLSLSKWPKSHPQG